MRCRFIKLSSSEGPIRSGTSCAATAARTITCSRAVDPCATSNCAPCRCAHADFGSLFCRRSTDVATPKRRMKGISGHQVLSLSSVLGL